MTGKKKRESRTTARIKGTQTRLGLRGGMAITQHDYQGAHVVDLLKVTINGVTVHTKASILRYKSATGKHRFKLDLSALGAIGTNKHLLNDTSVEDALKTLHSIMLRHRRKIMK
jgi:hypothetical protein